MNQKKCTKCKAPKPLSSFYKRKDRPSGYSSACKTCANGVKEKYLKTRIGLIGRIYHTQKNNSKKRGHNPPEYTKQELIDWCMSQDVFHSMYFDWVKSGYSTMQKPSCDRTDDSKGYSLNRLQITTWQENKDKGHADARSGILTTGNPHKPVIGTHITTGKVINFVSACDAARKTIADQSAISKCCNNNQKSAGGYMWKFEK